MTCLFCEIPSDEVLFQSEHWLARLDKFPVTLGHTLLIPKRHIANVDDLLLEEWTELLPLIRQVGNGADFNVGINRGKSAGQTIFHVHVHVFPRQEGDVKNPRGGIRNFKEPLVQYL